MNAEMILAAVLRLNLVASFAIVLVLTLRPLVLRRAGASVVYWLWLVVPMAAAASFLPAREQVVIVRFRRNRRSAVRGRAGRPGASASGSRCSAARH